MKPSNTVRRLPGLKRLFGLAAVGIALIGSSSAFAVSTAVVISEFRTRGPSGGNDEFVELYNLSTSPVNIGGWKINGSNSSGTTSTRVTITANTTLNPGCRYLVTNSGSNGYSGSVAGDQTYSTGITDDGGIALLNASGTVIDAVGMSAGSAYKEGTPLPTTTSNANQSQERKPAGQNTQDTDNNAADFALNSGSSNPQNLASTCTSVVDVAPAVSSTTPATAATNVAVNADVVVAFSEAVTAPAGAFTLTCATSGSHTFALSNTASTTFTLNPDADFANGEQCTVTVTAASVVDQDGTPDHMAADYSFSFTTVPAVVGACGSDHRLPLATTPSNLCAAGTPSAVTGSGPWTWSCSGSTGSTPAYCGAPVAVNETGFSILHVNDTHARLTPHKWQIPSKTDIAPVYEDVGGAAYLAGEMLALTAVRPTNSLVIDAGDISEGNPVGDFSGSENPLTIDGITLSGCAPLSQGSTSSNCGMTQFYQLLSRELLKQRGRGMDAVVVGNHDVRDAAYIKNLEHLRDSGVPVLSVNVRDIATHTPHFAPYTTLMINGTKVGLLGYTTQASEVGASLSSTLEVVDCDWSGTSAPCHLADYVNTLRNVEHVDVVVLVAHIGHSALVDQNPAVAANLLVDNGAAKLPEVVVTGHWHTWADTVWQPTELNYKTIFTESASYMKYIGQLNVDAAGKYLSATQHVLRNADITPDSDVQSLVDNLISQYNAAHATHVYDVVGYTDDNLMLDNDMRWWSPDEYPWSGNNTAGQWITDAMRWKAEQLFGSCDLAVEAGGGVRADIPAGPVTYLQVYETFPWSDDTFVRIDMSGQDIVNFLKVTNMDAGFSSALDVTAVDGTPTLVKFNGQPIDLNHIYTVAINNYMLAHPPAGYAWPNHGAPLTNSTLVRDGIVDFMVSQHATPATAYRVGGARYHLNGEYSGGYRAVVTMMNDQDTRPTFDAAYVRFLSATPDTLARRGNNQVPADLVNADGSVSGANRLSSMEIYRSYLGFRAGVLHPGDIVEFWGKASFYGGDPEFVDQEGIQSDGVEFKIVGHDDSLAKPEFVSSIGTLVKDEYKNHYVRFLATKTAADTVVDQNNQSLKVYDKTGYTAASLPGSVGNTLEISGVLTMESYGFRFRTDSATVTAAALPASSGISSRVDPLSGSASGAVTLTATASIVGGGYDLTPVADAQIESGSPTYNGGGGNNLYIQSSVSSYGNERAWLKFDLSSIPAGSTITGATLQLWNWTFNTSGSPDYTPCASLPVEVRSAANDSWTETGINWNTQPALGGVLDTQTLASGTKNVWYGWNVASFVQSEFGGDKTVSLAVKPVTEGSTDTISPGYGFDAKEYGSNAPVLHVTTQATASSIASVRFFYRYSADNASWGAWTQAGATDTTAPYSASFNFPNGYGYYEFYSVATDNLGGVEPTPAYAQTAVHYQAATGDPQTIDFAPPSPAPVNSSFPLSATASSGLAVVFSSQTTNVCTVAGNQVTTVAIGTCIIAADQPGDVGYWLAAPTVTRSFAVTGLSQTISFPAIGDRALGAAPFSVNATASSGLTVTIDSQTTSVCTVGGNTVTLVSAGTCTLAASQPGNASYGAAPVVTQSFTVSSVGGGGSSDGDVPLPAWAVAMLGAGLLGAMRQRRARGS